MNSGAYVLLNRETGSVYVGSSSNLSRRRQKHFRELKQRMHVNTHLQRSFDKYGEESFSFKVFRECPTKEARIVEQALLDALRGSPRLLNIALFSTGSPNEGRQLSEEHRAKIGAANAISLLGKKLTNEDTRKKLSESSHTRIRKPFNTATKLKMRNAKLGKPAPWNSYPRGSEWGRKAVSARWKKEGKVGYV